MIASTADEIAKGVNPIQYVTRDEVTDDDIRDILGLSTNGILLALKR